MSVYVNFDQDANYHYVMRMSSGTSSRMRTCAYSRIPAITHWQSDVPITLQGNVTFSSSFTMLPLLAAFKFLALSSPVQAASSVTRSSNSQVAAGWYAGWHATDYPLSEVSWNKYNTMYYSFA